MLLRVFFSLFLVVAVFASELKLQQTPAATEEKDPKFVKVALAVVSPWQTQQCYDNDWTIDLNTPQEWSKNGETSDLFTHVGQHWGCHQLSKHILLGGEAHTTHTVAYAGGFIPPTLFSFSVGSSVNLNSVLGGEWEKVNFDGAIGFVGGVIKRIIEVDDDNNIVRQLKFNDAKSLLLNWKTTGSENINEYLRKVTFTATADVKIINELVGAFATAALLGVQRNFEFQLDIYTSTDYGVLELNPPVPMSALSAEFVIKIKNWNYKSLNNRLGVELATIQKTARKETTALNNIRLITEDQGDFSASYWHFSNIFEFGSAEDGSEATGKLNIQVDEVPDDRIDDEIGNIVMELKARLFFGGSFQRASVNNVRMVSETARGASFVEIDPGFGIGQYPYVTDPSCTDGEKNGQEEGVDCGEAACPLHPCVQCHDGVLRAADDVINCESCNDGFLNGDETDVDCGGAICPACPTCSDGIHNGREICVDVGPDCPVKECPPPPCNNNGVADADEFGIDCGGKSCPACPMAQQQQRTPAPAADNTLLYAVLGGPAALICCALIIAAVAFFVYRNSQNKRRRRSSTRRRSSRATYQRSRGNTNPYELDNSSHASFGQQQHSHQQQPMYPASSPYGTSGSFQQPQQHQTFQTGSEFRAPY